MSHREVSVDPQPQLRGDPDESYVKEQKKAQDKLLKQADRLNRFVKTQLATSADEEDRSPGASRAGKPGPGIRTTSRPQNEATEPQDQVEKSRKTTRNKTDSRHQSRSDEERAEQEAAKRISNTIRIGKSNIRSSTPALRKTSLRDAKRRTAHESDEANE